jgi:hypothetical protein
LNAAGGEKLLISEWLISATLVDFNYLRAIERFETFAAGATFRAPNVTNDGSEFSDESNVSPTRMSMH